MWPNFHIYPPACSLASVVTCHAMSSNRHIVISTAALPGGSRFTGLLLWGGGGVGQSKQSQDKAKAKPRQRKKKQAKARQDKTRRGYTYIYLLSRFHRPHHPNQKLLEGFSRVQPSDELCPVNATQVAISVRERQCVRALEWMSGKSASQFYYLRSEPRAMGGYAVVA